MSCDPFQVMIYNPAFFKYVHEAWLDGHGHYPSTGFLSLLLAVHICDEVRPTKPWGWWRGDARQKLSNQEYFFEVGTCDMVVSMFSICSRSACLALAQTSTGTGTTTGRRTIWPERSDTRGSTMGITNTMSLCCWRTSKRSECLKGDDTWTISL